MTTGFDIHGGAARKTMRVLTFTTLFPNGVQSTRGLFVKMRMERVAAHCDIEVVAPVARRPALRAVSRTETVGAVDVHHPRFWSPPGEWARLKPALIARGAWPVVRRLHERAPFDLVDAHFAHPDAAAAAIIARRLGLPLVVTVRGSDIHRDLARPGHRALILRTLGQAAAVIAVAQPLADALREAGIPAERIEMIENGVDASHFAGVDRDAARRDLGLADDRRLLLSVGNLQPVKGHDVLLDAFALLGEDTELGIVGGGPRRAALEQQAERLGVSGRVRFLGRLAHEDLPRLYAAADVFCLPSRNEGCPNVVLEALAAGCPVAATRVGHVPYLVRDGENGRTAPSEDAPALADALQALLSKPLPRDSVRASVSGLTWERAAERVFRVFERSLDRTPTNTNMRIPQCG
jgi:glycosyltransferase involved in cell wall biosynthesis